MTPWVLTNLSIDSLYAAVLIHAETNRVAYNWIIWSLIKPTRKPLWKVIRGKRIQCGYKYIWINPTTTAQDEPANGTQHTFGVAGLIPSDTVWFYMFSLDGPYGKECQGPLMYAHSADIVPSQTLFEDWGHSNTINLERPGSAWTWAARRFTPTVAGNVATVQVRMYSNAGGDVLLVHMQIRNDDAAEPSDFVQEESSTTVINIPSPPAIYTYDFSGATLVTPGSYYWIAMFRRDRRYNTVRVYCDAVEGTPGRFDPTGVQPWYQNDRTMDIIVKS